MDKGTQEKVMDRFKLWPDYAVRCKACHTLHIISQLYTDEVKFPKEDLSIVSVACREHSNNFYDYGPDDLMPYTKSKANAKAGFDWNAEVRCKECNHIHPFGDYGSVANRADLFEFPKSDFTVVRIPCLRNLDKFHEYGENEILEPRIKSSNSEMEKRLSLLENRLDNIDRSLLGLGTNAASKNDLEKLGKELKESFSGFLADAVSKSAKPSQKGGAEYVT